MDLLAEHAHRYDARKADEFLSLFTDDVDISEDNASTYGGENGLANGLLAVSSTSASAGSVAM
jgi:hypothetical protein